MAEEKVATETSQKIQEITPEEKLFRLIAAAGKNDAELQELLTRFVPAQKKSGFGSFLKSPQAEKITGSPVARYAALVFFGLLTFYFLSGIRMGQTFYVAPGARLAEVGIEHATDFFPYFFTDERKTLLPPVTGPVEALSPRQTSGVSIPVKDPAPFRLVGISWDSQGPVAMVESGNEDRAKFVRKGDVVSGNVRVEEIKDYTIVLSSGIKKWELT